MATEQQHRIRRQILELTTLDETVAERLRPELGRMQHQHLVALIDRCLTEVSSPGRLHRIERLEIDLGIIDLKEFEHQFADRLGVQLRRALAKPLRDGGHRDGGRRNSGRRDEPDATSRLEVLDHFVHTGRLPWWVDASTSTVIDQHVEHLVKHSARSFADWARRLPSSVLRRLILHLDDARLTTLHEVMRTDTTESHEHKRNIETLLQVSGAVPGASRERFRAAVWQAVLDTTGQRESVNATAFWHAVLTRVAMDLGTPFGTLIERLADALEVPNGKRSESVLARTIASLVRHTADKPGAPSPSELDEILELDEIRQILTWLARGEHSSQDTANSAPEVLWNGQQVEPIPFAETQESALGPHSFFFELLSSLGKALEHVSARQRQHWLGILEDLDHRLRIDGWARPETSKALTRLLREVVQQRLLPADETRQYLESLESSLPRLRREVRDLIRHLDETASQASRATENAERFEPDVAVSTFSQADTAYVGNAGLVILWPFLGHFFEHLGLMTDKAFRDEAAQHRAVGLLQWLVTEDPSPPEYQTTLNKVLCGLDLDQVFDFGPPVTEEEAQECSHLISAVIAQAPILGDMSHQGFRGSFMLRKGMLTVEPPMWMLRVERETYDIVLDRFPWSLDWVKLPWMEAPLRVEW